VINSKWILTALHCVVKDIEVPVAEWEVYPVSRVFVIVGDHQLSVNNETEITRVYGTSEIVLSESASDFSLVKVDGVLDINLYTPICLPNIGDDFRGQSTIVTGWGKTIPTIFNDTNGSADILQEIVLPFTTSIQCDNIQNQLGIEEPYPNILCFGTGEEGKGGCFGDSGGPLIVQKQGQSKWTLAGIVSAGTTEVCASQGTYGIAVEVSAFTDFIRTTAKDGEFCDE